MSLSLIVRVSLSIIKVHLTTEIAWLMPILSSSLSSYGSCSNFFCNSSGRLIADLPDSQWSFLAD